MITDINTADINVAYVNLPSRVKSFVTENDDMSYTVILNSRASREQNIQSYVHELRHICGGDYRQFDADKIEYCAHGCI